MYRTSNDIRIIRYEAMGSPATTATCCRDAGTVAEAILSSEICKTIVPRAAARVLQEPWNLKPRASCGKMWKLLAFSIIFYFENLQAQLERCQSSWYWICKAFIYMFLHFEVAEVLHA